MRGSIFHGPLSRDLKLSLTKVVETLTRVRGLLDRLAYGLRPRGVNFSTLLAHKTASIPKFLRSIYAHLS